MKPGSKAKNLGFLQAISHRLAHCVECKLHVLQIYDTSVCLLMIIRVPKKLEMDVGSPTSVRKSRELC